MNDKYIIIAGLVIFFAVFAFPFWYNHGVATLPPQIKLAEKAEKAKNCVADKEVMRKSHMQLLARWRNMAVREGKTVYAGANGNPYAVSLSNTCMDCHSNKAEFCDKCHTYASISPYCWECHTFPEKKK